MFDIFRKQPSLKAILEKERDAILACDFKLLEKLYAEKTAAYEKLQAAGLSKEELHSCDQMAKKNNRLLTTIEESLKTVKGEITSMIANDDTPFETYNIDGVKAVSAQHSRSMYKKV